MKSVLFSPFRKVNQLYIEYFYNKPEDILSRRKRRKEKYKNEKLHGKTYDEEKRSFYAKKEDELLEERMLEGFSTDITDGPTPLKTLLELVKTDSSEYDVSKYPKEGYYLAPSEPGRPVILAFHGRGSTADMEFATLLGIARENDFGLYCPEYTFYPEHEDEIIEPTTRELEKSTEKAVSFLNEIAEIPNSKIIIYGECMGSGAAIYTASRKTKEPYMGLVVQAPAASSKDLIIDYSTSFLEQKVEEHKIYLSGKIRNRINLPEVLVKQLPYFVKKKHHFDNVANMQQVNIPATVIICPEDAAIPTAHHERVFEALPKSNCAASRLMAKKPGHMNASKEELSDAFTGIERYHTKRAFAFCPVTSANCYDLCEDMLGLVIYEKGLVTPEQRQAMLTESKVFLKQHLQAFKALQAYQGNGRKALTEEDIDAIIELAQSDEMAGLLPAAQHQAKAERKHSGLFRTLLDHITTHKVTVVKKDSFLDRMLRFADESGNLPVWSNVMSDYCENIYDKIVSEKEKAQEAAVTGLLPKGVTPALGKHAQRLSTEPIRRKTAQVTVSM